MHLNRIFFFLNNSLSLKRLGIPILMLGILMVGSGSAARNYHSIMEGKQDESPLVYEGDSIKSANKTPEDHGRTDIVMIDLSIRKEGDSQATITPNPNKGCFCVTLPPVMTRLTGNLEIVNTSGKRVFSTLVTPDCHGNLKIDLSGMCSGKYFLHAWGNAGSISQPFTICK